MNLRWIEPMRRISPGVREARAEVEWEPVGFSPITLFGDPASLSSVDSAERSWLIEETWKVVREIRADIRTRRALIYNLHPSDLEVNCLSLFHFTIRERDMGETLELFAYLRSTDVRRLGYDLVTVDLVYRAVRKRLREAEIAPPLGSVTVHLHSLHEFV